MATETPRVDEVVLLHVGCGNRHHEGMVNLRKEDLDISQPWPYADESVDGIVSMQVLQQLYWRDLVPALHEMYRVLKKGGVMRFGTILVESNKPLSYILDWNNVNLFSLDLLKRVLKHRIGFTKFRVAEFRDSMIPEFRKVDNRSRDKGTFFIEVIK